MKAFFLALGLMTTLTSLQAASIEGTYKNKKMYHDRWTESKAECKKNGGIYDGKEGEGMCLMPTADVLKISAGSSRGTYKIDLETIQPNTHSCGFEGEAIRNGYVLTSTVDATDYSEDTPRAVKCVVKVNIKGKGRSADVTDNGKCREFCGMNGWLETDGLLKVKN